MTFRLDVSPLAFQKIGILPDPEKERRKKEEEARAQRASLGADISASLAPFDPASSMGMGEGPMSRPAQSPQFGGDFLNAGGSPGQLIDLIRGMQPADRDAYEEAFKRAVNNIIVKGERIEDQMPVLIPALNDRFKVAKPKTAIEAAKEALSPEDATRAARIEMGLEPKTGPPPSPIDTAERDLSPEDAKRAARIRAGLEPKPGGDKAATSPEEQFMADVRAILPSIDKMEYGKGPGGEIVITGVLTDDQRFQKAVLKAQEMRGLARNAGVFQGPPAPVAGAGLASPAAVPATPTNETRDQVDILNAAEEMQASGIDVTEADLADPQFMEVYRRWKEAQGANVP